MADKFTDGVTPPDKANTDDNQTTDVTAYLAERVGEGKKYETLEIAVEALAKKAIHADKHIETLLTEKQTVAKQLETTLTQSKGIEDVLAAINDAGNKLPVVNETPVEPLTLETVLAAVNANSTEEIKATKRKETISATWDMLAEKEAFGTPEAAKAAVAKYIGSHTDRQTVVNAMAISDPENLLALLRKYGESVQFTEDYEGIHIEGVPNGKLTLAIIKEIREKHPEIYRTKAFQNRIHMEL